MSNMQNEEIQHPTETDIAAETEQQPTLSMPVAGAKEIPGTEDGDRPPLLMLFMADGSLRWVAQPE